MRKYVYAAVLSAVLSGVVVSCESYDEVPPVENTSAKSYKMPDPETLTQDDRAVIEEMEREYNENAK